MSYLVDALKKAERERHAQRGADMQALAGSEAVSAGAGPPRLLRWIVMVLVVCNLALLAWVMRPRPAENDAAPAKTTTAQGEASAAPQRGGQADAMTATREPAPTRPQPAPAGASKVEQRVQPGTRGAALADRGSRPLTAAQGRVTYAPAPLDHRRDVAAQPPRENAPAGPTPGQSAGEGVPQVQINGHLYSSVPGRSFILVNGRRYHEGERLAAGPAVESIDASGATLNYRGRRYHVAGPG